MSSLRIDDHCEPRGLGSTGRRALRRRVRVAVVAASLAALTWPAAGFAAPLLPVQGRLNAAGGGPVADGVYPLTFRLYDSALADKALWKEIHIAVPISAGMFSLALGGVEVESPLPIALFTQQQATWVGVQVSADPELPRAPLQWVPYALHAATADALTTPFDASQLTGTIDGNQIGVATVPDKVLAFNYAASDAKGGPALGLTCTGCIGADHLQAGLLAPYATKESLESLAALGGKNVFTQPNTFVAGIGVGGAPGPGCGFDLAEQAGGVCIGGKPALVSQFAADASELAGLAHKGQIVYRTDTDTAWMFAKGKWRQLAFVPACGDGAVESPEQCDDGEANADAPDKCRTDCSAPACGDGIIDSGEACDDGNKGNNDACVACKVATCGDGHVQVGTEDCDDGNGDATDACVACKSASCGDGHIQVGVEVCEAGQIGKNCADLLGGGYSGAVQCAAGCLAYDTTGCKKPLTQIVVAAQNNASTGDMGGIAGADAKCAAQATAAGKSGKWRAFLSAPGQEIRTFFSGQDYSGVPVFNIKNEQFAASWSALMGNNGNMGGIWMYAFDGKTVDEGTGANPDWEDADGWHGSNTNGTLFAGQHCNGWSSSAAGVLGRGSELDGHNLLAQEQHTCNQNLAVMCVRYAE